MKKQTLYFKHKYSDVIFKDTVFDSEKEVAVMKHVPITSSLSDAPIEILKFRNIHQLIDSGEFDILTDDSFTEREIKILIDALYATEHLMDKHLEIVDKIKIRLVNALHSGKYLPNDKNKIIG